MSADPEHHPAADTVEDAPDLAHPLGNPKVQAGITIALFLAFVLFVAICLPLYFF